MARFDVSGLRDLILDMEKCGETAGDVADEMLLAAAGEVREQWRLSAERHQHRDTGDMIASITYPRAPKTVDGVRTIDIYPQGVDGHGIRNAEKAFILNYGTSWRPGSRWIEEADVLSGAPVERVMRDIWERFLKKRKL